MKKLICLFVLTFFCTTGLLYAQETCPIIPLPENYDQVSEVFNLNGETYIQAKDPSFASSAYYFQNQILRHTGISVKNREAKNANSIVLLRNKKQANEKERSYSIKMNGKEIIISASDDEGIFNGVASLLQMVLKAKHENNSLLISCWNIKDAPQYQWRGFMLDESRHFFGKEMVKLILDQMAMLKLNRFHWHLTDAQGWRIEIKKYPNLTLVGGIGNHTDTLAPARYYTQEDIKEIIAYATQRHIQVIPEIDMPGHATAANRAYPEYSGGWTERFPHFTFNPGKEGTYDYLTNILGEVSVLFPSKMLHLGGDEVSFGIKGWESKTEVQDLMKNEELKTLHDVELYFFRRMSDSALKLFDKVLAWDETADSEMPVDSTIIFWWRHNLPGQLQKAFEKGFTVVLCPRVPLYFDFVQDSIHFQGRRWSDGNFSSLEKVYHFSDRFYKVAPEYRKSVLGIQANLWTETVSGDRRLQFMIFPRMAALAEAAWTSPDNRDYQLFLKRLEKEFSLYDRLGIYYFNPLKPSATPEAIDKQAN